MTDLLRDWDGFVGLAIVDTNHTFVVGDLDTPVPLASITKMLTAFGLWIASQEGGITWAEVAADHKFGGHEYAVTVADLASHQSGLDFEQAQLITVPRTKRVYSNAGWRLLGTWFGAHTGIPLESYVAEAILSPLGAVHTDLGEDVAASAVAPLRDLISIARHVLDCMDHGTGLWHPATIAACTSNVGGRLRGILPGFGPHPDQQWGLGVERHADKSPHWLHHSQPADVWGHFGQAGSMWWFDPQSRRSVIALGDHPFGKWAIPLWSEINRWASEAPLDR